MKHILTENYRQNELATRKAKRKLERPKRNYLTPTAKLIIQRIYMKPWTERQLAEAFDVTPNRIMQIIREGKALGKIPNDT